MHAPVTPGTEWKVGQCLRGSNCQVVRGPGPESAGQIDRAEALATNFTVPVTHWHVSLGHSDMSDRHGQ
jgi:hypothetical protein